MPRAVRVASREAVLPNVRAGRLEITVVTDHGTVYAFTRDVDVNRTLELNLF
jgi:hypothetical protein